MAEAFPPSRLIPPSLSNSPVTASMKRFPMCRRTSRPPVALGREGIHVARHPRGGARWMRGARECSWTRPRSARGCAAAPTTPLSRRRPRRPPSADATGSPLRSSRVRSRLSRARAGGTGRRRLRAGGGWMDDLTLRGAAASAPGDGFHLMTESIFSATRLLNDGWCRTSDGDGVSVRPRGVRSAASGRAS